MTEEQSGRIEELAIEYQEARTRRDQAQSDLLAKIDALILVIQEPSVASKLKHAVS